ncbi:MAG: hypothetical protein JST16_00590 [Bdellovibrionales bacterium]|nr:hypothetical protein [Bdellovibrionales bacterium]
MRQSRAWILVLGLGGLGSAAWAKSHRGDSFTLTETCTDAKGKEHKLEVVIKRGTVAGYRLDGRGAGEEEVDAHVNMAGKMTFWLNLAGESDPVACEGSDS